MIRTILVTEVEDAGHNHIKLYGRQDLVSLYNKGLKIINTYKEVYEMNDTDFAKYGKLKKRGN